MNQYKRIICALGLTVLSLTMVAQSGTNSPYSQYGLGVMAEQGQGFNRGMNGLSYGLHQRNQVNAQNPASYANVDSLTFIFDAGVSIQNTNFEENITSQIQNNIRKRYELPSRCLSRRTIIPLISNARNVSNSKTIAARNIVEKLFADTTSE